MLYFPKVNNTINTHISEEIYQHEIVWNIYEPSFNSQPENMFLAETFELNSFCV